MGANTATHTKPFKIGQLFEGRLNRGPYLCIILAEVVVDVLTSYDGNNLLLAVVLLIVSAALLIVWFSAAVRRMHDVGHSAWGLLWFIVPFANIVYALYLLFKTSEDGPNRYGAVPDFDRPMLNAILNR